MAQLVEHHLAKVRVAGSNPVVRSEKCWWRTILATLGYFASVSFGSHWEYRLLSIGVRGRLGQTLGQSARAAAGRFAGERTVSEMWMWRRSTTSAR